ncbi:MAG: magnesium transporter [Candidatus Riflebacteria bacterium]|jgi:magnesium transporter|nr:magnesium transporter [Candidatus Riflebacteria bacterium]
MNGQTIKQTPRATSFFLASLIGAPVYSESGRQAGKITDFTLSLRNNWPCFDQAIVYDFDSLSEKIAARSSFNSFSPTNFTLGKSIHDLPAYVPKTEQPLASHIWDKSVIDTVSVRTVQVNDLEVVTDETGEIWVSGIDISFRGALRRLGLEPYLGGLLNSIGNFIQPEIITWDKIIGFNDQFSALTTELTSDNFQNLHPADLAEILEELDDSERLSIIETLDEDVAAETIAEADSETQLQIIEQLDTETASEIIEEMDPDEAADLLQDMDQDRAREILDHMDLDEASDVRKLLEHDEYTAGGIMTTEYAAIFEEFTVANAFSHMRLVAPDIEIIYYMYVIDNQERLKGVVSIRDLLSANPSVSVSEIMDDDIVSVRPETPQEEVATILNKYDYMAIPVVNDQQKILGVVTVDDIMDVMEEEASEDIFKLAGTSDEELTYSSPLQACRARLPWLLITLGTGFITSTILKYFMDEFKEVIALVFFVPVVMAMGGNTGIQSSTLVIRGLALNSFTSGDLFKRLIREIATGAVMGVACGLVVGVWAQYLITSGAASSARFSALYLATTVGLSMTGAMTFAAMFGAMVPILFDRFKIDPAVASGPFVTSSNDIFALLIYYGVSVVLLTVG